MDVRYVGIARDSHKRLQGHRKTVRNTAKRVAWVQSLLASDDDVEMIILEESDDYGYIRSRELNYIQDLRQAYDLLNVQITGKPRGGIMTSEGRAKISASAKARVERDRANGRVYEMHSAEARAKCSLRGYKHSEKNRAAYSVAAKLRFTNPAERAKISSATSGLIKSLEHRAKISLGQRTMVKVRCPVCGYEGRPCHVGGHRKRHGH